MATFKAEVQRHQQRRDGKYPVSIRVTNNRQSVRIPTGLYVDARQVNRKTFEIKDSFVIERTNKTIRDYERSLLGLSTEELTRMSAAELKSFLTASNIKVDYLNYCREIIASNPKKMGYLKTVVSLIGEMGVCSMRPEDVTTRFVERFKSYIDDKVWEEKDGTEHMYKASTKNQFLSAIKQSFESMKAAYNTDFVKVITHDITIKYYDKEENRKKTMSVEDLRAFFSYRPTRENQIVAQDMCLLSFGLCGINLRDLTSMTPDRYNAEDDRIEYYRGKTGVPASVKIPTQVKAIFEKYKTENGERLFQFGTYKDDENISHLISSAIGTICKHVGIDKISSYWFRHTWSTIARNKLGASKDDVDLCLAHKGNNPMADVYIKKDWEVCDRLSQAVLDFVFE